MEKKIEKIEKESSKGNSWFLPIKYKIKFFPWEIKKMVLRNKYSIEETMTNISAEPCGNLSSWIILYYLPYNKIVLSFYVHIYALKVPICSANTKFIEWSCCTSITRLIKL